MKTELLKGSAQCDSTTMRAAGGKRYLNRLLAILAFVAGGLATELSRPVYCTLLNVANAAPARKHGHNRRRNSKDA